jgi:hypothetical protein
MDESGLGKQVSDVICCIAGFQGRNPLWISFEEEWARTLEQYGIDEFHAKEFWARDASGGLVGKYRGWTFDHANSFISDLVRIIQRHKLYMLAAVVNLADFFSYDIEERRFLTGATFDVAKWRFITTGKPSTAYFVALNAVVMQGVKRSAEGRQLCHFIFDEQDQYASLAKDRIAQLRNSSRGKGIREYLGDAGYFPSRRVRALQSADLAAHLCKEYYKREMTGRPLDIEYRSVLTPLEILTHILNDDNYAFFKIGKKEMDAMLEDIAQGGSDGKE